MRLLIAGGGTGGHLFPGIAVAEEFLARDTANEVLFVGTERGVEAKVLPTLGYRLELISASGIRGKSPLAGLKGVAMLLYAYAESRRLLKEFRPDLVLGVGGYVSGPTLLAARGLLIPRFVHEQNAIPGMTNKVLSRFAALTFISLEESRRFFPKEKTLLTGNPLRRQILDMVEKANPAVITDTARYQNGVGEEFHLFIFGGSQGAHAINAAMIGALPLLKESGIKLAITHQTGEKDCSEVAAAYRTVGIDAEVTPFISDMAAEYTKADLIICRAGATTIAEVTACGKACLFIPFPHAVDDHQRRNAEALLKKDACFMMLEHELTGETLAESICTLAEDTDLVHSTGEAALSLARMNAAGIIVDEMMKSN